MKNILVPTDFSNNAYDALFYATRLLKNKECTFYLLNTFEVRTPIFTSRVYPNRGRDLYEKNSAHSLCKLKELVHSIQRDTEGFKHQFEIISVSKPLIITIEKTILSKNIDLVVMGTKGATSQKDIFMGSNTVKVIDAINSCPVLAIPENVDVYPIYNIAFATDFSHKFQTHSLNALNAFCDLNEVILKIIFVSNQSDLTNQQQENKAVLETFFKHQKHSTINIQKNRSVEKHITNIVGYLEFDMLAMIKYRHGFIEIMTHEAIIKKIGHNTKIPFLIIPDELINVILHE